MVLQTNQPTSISTTITGGNSIEKIGKYQFMLPQQQKCLKPKPIKYKNKLK